MPGPIGNLAGYIRDFIVVPDQLACVIAAWVAASHLCAEWERFPHLGVTSPEKRSGKTKLLQVLEPVLPNPFNASNISAAAIWRMIEDTSLSLMIDEAQHLKRGGSESSQVISELLNSAIDRDAIVIRCVGQEHTPTPFHIYCPKIVACIGELDGVLADRCLPIGLSRKTDEDKVRRCFSRDFKPYGLKKRGELQKWLSEKKNEIVRVYKTINPFDIENDRLAELLMPLQAMLTVGGGEFGIRALEGYAVELDRRDNEPEKQSPGVMLLAACRELLQHRDSFVPTWQLISELANREEEPWGTYSRGNLITPEALARLLSPYKIKSKHTPQRDARGYYAADFADAWKRYLPAQNNPSDSSTPSNSSRNGGEA